MTKEKGITPAALNALTSGDIDNFIVASTPGGIEAQEAAGQKELVSSNRLPIDGTIERSLCGADVKEIMESYGFKFGAKVDGIFIGVDFPPGWELIPTGHSMWSELRHNGIKRAGVFYKAAFYDRSAHMNWERRYYIDYRPADGYYWPYSGPKDESTVMLYFVKDLKTGVNLREDRITVKQGDYVNSDFFVNELREWLLKEYPDCQNPFAYWGE